MQGKKRSHREASPGKTGSPLQNQEKQHRVNRVEQEIDVMMPGRAEPEQSTIQSVREPGERMPVGLLETRECPANRAPSQSGTDVSVLGNVMIVIEVDEGVLIDAVRSEERRVGKECS